MTRREFSRSTKLAAWERSGGICDGCRQKIIGVAEYDHLVADALDGEPTLANCQVLCSKCHRRKTSSVDVPAIAKGKRMEAKRSGLKRKGKPLPGTKASGWRHKISGEWVKR